jgi:hypothetical protein
MTPRQIRDLCDELVACEDQELALLIARQLQFELHQHIEALRARLPVVPISNLISASYRYEYELSYLNE